MTAPAGDPAPEDPEPHAATARPSPAGTKPSPTGRLAVIVPYVNAPGDLRGCLQALDRERTSLGLEVVVVERHGAAAAAAVLGEFPWVEVVSVAPGTPIPVMRAAALDRATAPSIAIIEDHVIVPPGWGTRMLAARTAGDRVAAGPIENGATDRLVDRAAFLCEYGPLMPPLPSGAVPSLPGNNTVYDRELLLRHRGILAAGGWEDRLHAALRSEGVVLASRPELRAVHVMHYSTGSYTAQRYLYSRAHAGLRVRGAAFAKRLAMGLAACALPPVLLWRVVSAVWRKRRHRLELVRALPLIAWFTVVWAAGEVVGFWFGPGNAPGRVR